MEESKTSKSRKLIDGLESPRDEAEMQMETMSMKNKMQFLSDKPELTHGGMYRHTEERYDRNGVEIRNKRERQPNGQKKRLKYKVLFADQCVKDEETDTKHPLETVIQVESYKKYNLDHNYNDKACCLIF